MNSQHNQPGMLPLKGVRVLDFGMNIAGPQATNLLADLGADVIKVESPQGDTARSLEPKINGVSAMSMTMNRNKRYLALDLRNPESAVVLEGLLRWADAAVQNLRPGKATELGIDADQCHAINPRLIHASIEAFYPVDGTRPGYDLLVQAETGMMHLTGDADGSPSRLPGSLLDHTTGLYAAFGISAALHGPRDRHSITVTMSDVAQSLLGDRVAAYLLNGLAPERMGSAISVTTPLQSYRTGDGDLVIGAANDTLFRRLGETLGTTVADDPRFTSQAARLAHREELNIALEEALASDSADVWYQRLVAAGIPVALVRDMPAAVDRHRELSRTGLLQVEGMPGAELVANPLGSAITPTAPGPVGGDSLSLLVDVLGFSPDAAQQAVDSGAVVAAVGAKS